VSSRTWTRSSGWSGAGAGRKRNRRLAAGGLALLVAVGGSLAAYAALRDDGDRVPGISDGSSPAALPTALLLTCDGETTTGGYVQVEVVDPEGVFVPTELPCGDVTGWFYDYAPDAEGDPDPVASTREQEWVEPGDIVEPAGYPESEPGSSGSFETVRSSRSSSTSATGRTSGSKRAATPARASSSDSTVRIGFGPFA